MTVRPSPPMRDFEVSAILREVAEPGSGKSQFRRPLKPQPTQGVVEVRPVSTEIKTGRRVYNMYDFTGAAIYGLPRKFVMDGEIVAPFAIGDLLWCREAWAKVGDEPDDIHACPDLRIHAYYRADAVDHERQHWRSSTQMPRWASRLTLEVVGVKIERLQEISEEDAIAEGIDMDSDFASLCQNIADQPWPNDLTNGSPIISVFEKTWGERHGRGSWSANPFVSAVTFRPHLANIDDLLRQREGGR